MFEDIRMSLAAPTDDEVEFNPMLGFGEEEEEGQSEKDSLPTILPVLPLKNTVMFPGVVLPITIGREKSIRAIHKAQESHKYIAVLSQQDTDSDSIDIENLYQIGTVAQVMRLLRMPDGSTTAVLQGKRRFEVVNVVQEEPFMETEIRLLDYEPIENDQEFKALISVVRDKSQRIIELSPQIPNEAIFMLKNIKSNTFLLNFIASNMGVKTPVKQELLSKNNLVEKAELLLKYLDTDLQLLELKDEIEGRVRTDIDKQQRDYFLNQQLRTIQEELGGTPHEDEANEFAQRAEAKKWNEKVRQHFDKELAKLRRMHPHSPEHSIVTNYIEMMLDLPWGEMTEDNFDLPKVQKVLNRDHYGLDDVKDRIMEHLAVLKLKGDMKAPILLLSGPPGVGKTSLGKSIAEALGRKYVRMSLGGVSDEAEIRGHRKTYIGSLPGRVIQSLKKAGSDNPVFILDEIDKVGHSHRGDPSSALLEVLDPEQNSTFYDNYLEVEYDLSKVLFIATANYLGNIQPALLDRMEVIDLSGYSVEEKTEIAKRHLIPNQRKEHGLQSKHVKFSEEVIHYLIRGYTREAGVRSLERRVASVMRKIALKVAKREKYEVDLTVEDVNKMLGRDYFTKEITETDQVSGIATGLVWTSVGGNITFIEAFLSRGNGNLHLTGNLGSVMRESGQLAMTYLKINSEKFGIPNTLLQKHDIHVHVPEGAVPKEGPSAGITLLTAIISAFRKQPVKKWLAMTGEITLRGKVMPVGGIKEKVLAAKRAGVKEVILCHENQRDVEEINQEYLQGIDFHFVKQVEEVANIAFDDLSLIVDEVEEAKKQKEKEKAEQLQAAERAAEQEKPKKTTTKKTKKDKDKNE